jgi:hypothetical protein
LFFSGAKHRVARRMGFIHASSKNSVTCSI